MINSEEIEKLCISAGELRSFRARKYVKEKRVNIDEICESDKYEKTIFAHVKGSNDNVYSVNVSVTHGKVSGYNCDCMDESRICKHILAVLLEVYNKYNDITILNKNTFKYKEFAQLMNSFSRSEDQKLNYIKGEVQLIPVIKPENYNRFSVSFKIGISKWYKIKNIVDFCTVLSNKESFYYGKNLEFVHMRDAFSEDSLRLLDFIVKYGDVIKYSNSNMQYSYYGGKVSESKVFLEGNTWDELFDILVGQKVNFDGYPIPFLFEESSMNNRFHIEDINDNECKLVNNIKFEFYVEGNKYIYVAEDNKLIKYIENTDTVRSLLAVFFSNDIEEIVFSKKELPSFFTLVFPRVKKFVSLDKLSEESLEKYMPKELAVKLFLDIAKSGNILCDVKFCYGDDEFNPFNNAEDYVARNSISEQVVMECFKNTGFKIDNENHNLFLDDEEKIYDFLTRGINYYMEKFEILATDNFKAMDIKHPRIGTIGVKIENNLLNVNFSSLDFDMSEVKEIMTKYKLKKKYHRLKDGTFLTLEENKDIEFIDDLLTGAGVDFKNFEKNEIRLPIHRSLYLNKLLDSDKTKKVSKDDSFKKIVREINDVSGDENIKMPDKMEDVLRFYQKTGYKWLKTLDSYGFGGVLADDMGLGKTLQVISVILSYKESGGDKTSIVVCPSSLVLNWDREIKKFAPSISVLIISGSANDRHDKIMHFNEYDLVITSYDSLKRDIDLYTAINADFKFVVADEAQYIKNGNTQNAKSLKSLEAEIRFALTGTPIENSLAELWSIFDYIMPGYLFSYNKFKRNYELPIIREGSQSCMNKLKMMIEPFILRRHKKDVLTELPEKTITLMYNDMEENQKKIYLNYLMQTKNELKSEIETGVFEKNKIKILALLTRLRQICCHPGLFIDNYYGASGKLEQCMEIIKDATAGGHKILLFSSYTSMFDILETELNRENIKYFKLTGQTKVDERIKLVEEFNKNPDIKVFLISLKAGGTGLNLTGADVVIHYDPWWNIAAENQATDRAYRIGQKNNVQVYKLITKDSIEEKIQELQDKKLKLIDDVLSTEETFINKLSKEDILALFE